MQYYNKSVSNKPSPIELIIQEMFSCFTRSIANKEKVSNKWANIVCSKGYVESEVRAVSDQIVTDLDAAPSLKQFLSRLNTNRQFNGKKDAIVSDRCSKYPFCYNDGYVSVLSGNRSLAVPNLCPCKSGGVEAFVSKMKQNQYMLDEMELGGKEVSDNIMQVVKRR